MGLDAVLFEAVLSFTGNPFLDSLMVFFAEYLVILVPLTLVYYWFQGREGKEISLLTFSSTVLSILITYVLGLFYFHDNPSALYDTIAPAGMENAFPSQHTTTVFAAAWPLFWKQRKRVGTLLVLAGIGTGFGRVYIGEHWPLDILGALLASLIGFGIIYLAEEYLEQVFEPLIEFGESLEHEIKLF